LYLDEYNLVASLGAAANVQPLAVVQSLYNDGLTFLGTAIVPAGKAHQGEKALTVRSVDPELNVRSDVMYGSLVAIPLQSYEPGMMLELVPARSFDVGQGPGKKIKIEYEGGTVGLIVDARGRPIEFDAHLDARRQQVERWLWEMTGA
jgi:hypothetical protein